MKFNCFMLLVIFVVELSGCKNNDNVFPVQKKTAITVVNASADTLNVYLNGTRQNNLSSLFPGGSVTDLVVPAGSQNYQFKKAGAFSVLFSVNLNLTDSTYNSLFVCGETSNFAFNTLDYLPQNSNSASSDTAYVRFVNASSDAGNLNASIGGTIAINSVAFKNASSFTIVTSGQNEIKIYQASNSKLLKDTIITIQPNYNYTLFSKGLLNGTGNSKFGLGILTN